MRNGRHERADIKPKSPIIKRNKNEKARKQEK